MRLLASPIQGDALVDPRIHAMPHQSMRKMTHPMPCHANDLPHVMPIFTHVIPCYAMPYYLAMPCHAKICPRHAVTRGRFAYATPC